MDIRKEVQGEKLIVYLSGKLDTNASPEFSDFINQELDGITELVVDVKELFFISSSGLRVLLSAHRTMSKKGKMIVRHPNSYLMEVFTATCFTDFLNLED